MSHAFANTLAALAAIVLAFTSLGTIVTIPPAQAHGGVASVELA